jgi:hypothetical protein
MAATKVMEKFLAVHPVWTTKETDQNNQRPVAVVSSRDPLHLAAGKSESSAYRRISRRAVNEIKVVW